MAIDDLHEISTWRRFRRGFAYPFKGVRLLMRHPVRLGPFVILPALISASIIVFATLLVTTTFPLMLNLVYNPGAEAAWYAHLAWWSLVFGAGAATFLATVAVAYLGTGIIAIPFNDLLSQRVEELVLGPVDEPFEWRVLFRDLAQSVVHSVLSLLLWALTMIGLLLLNLVPALGSVLSFVLGVGASSFFLSREMMDGALSRRRLGYAHKWRIVGSERALFLGLGMASWALLWIPLLNFLMLPMSVIGGTLLYCELERAKLVLDAQGNRGFVDDRRDGQPLLQG